ncbi:MAG: hypothetical protein KU37_02820 [Sulfuricurvum sp. PC08-66]|nr:MAG: hypothetical protein KU37_02820 [Sulfuricurvum sp. PC08-66]
MIEINSQIVVEIGTFLPYNDTKEELLEALYALLPSIHREIECLNYELFWSQEGALTSVGRWKSSLGYNLHENMRYIEEFKRTLLPVLCQEFTYTLRYSVVPPMSALSLLNE